MNSCPVGHLLHRRRTLGLTLSEVYMRRLDVLNRGFGGYTSKW